MTTPEECICCVEVPACPLPDAIRGHAVYYRQ